MDTFVLALLGIIAGCISSLFGLGGGMIIVPSMLYFNTIIPSMEFSTHHAVGISVMQMIFSSFFGTYLNIFKKKNLDIKHAIFLGLGGAIGASFSGFLLDLVEAKHLTLIFLIISCLTFYKFLFGSKPKQNENVGTKDKRVILVIVGMLTGVFAVSLGIGGGILLTPLLMYYLGFDTKKIVPMSLFFILFSSTSGIVSLVHHEVITNTVLHAGLTVGIFSIVGVIIGQKLMDKISTSKHKIILTVLYLLSIIGTFNKTLSYYGII